MDFLMIHDLMIKDVIIDDLIVNDGRDDRQSDN